MFDEKSRYAALLPYVVVNRAGRVINVVPAAEPTSEPLAGYHLRIQAQRLDHIAARYLNDPAAFWRLCDANGAVLPEALAETREVAVPAKRGG